MGSINVLTINIGLGFFDFVIGVPGSNYLIFILDQKMRQVEPNLLMYICYWTQDFIFCSNWQNYLALFLKITCKFILFNILQEMVSTAGEKALCGCLYGLLWFLRYLHASGEFKCGHCGNDTKSNSYCGGWNYCGGKIVCYYWTKALTK